MSNKIQQNVVGNIVAQSVVDPIGLQLVFNWSRLVELPSFDEMKMF